MTKIYELLDDKYARLDDVDEIKNQTVTALGNWNAKLSDQ